MTFIDHALSPKVSSGFTGGPAWETLWKRLRSGRSRRKPKKLVPTHRFTADYALLGDDGREEILHAIWVAMGSAHSFRFKDPQDHRVTNTLLGVGDGTDEPIQLFKTYTWGPAEINRPITLPTQWALTADGSPYTDFTVDPLTGLATPTTVWPEGAVLRWSGKFDSRVCFEQDYNPTTAITLKVGTVTIALIEVMD